jgi:hypothetical protein
MASGADVGAYLTLFYSRSQVASATAHDSTGLPTVLL